MRCLGVKSADARFALFTSRRLPASSLSPAAAAGGDNVWAGWVPASAGEGEATAAGMKEKLRAKQAGEGGSGEVKAEEQVKEEDLVTREKSIGTGALCVLGLLGLLGMLGCGRCSIT